VNELRAQGADRAALADALDWAESGWPDFAFYAEIMEAAPNAQIFGAGQPSADVRRAMLEGAAGVSDRTASIYGLDRRAGAGGAGGPRGGAGGGALRHAAARDAAGMVEAQRFRTRASPTRRFGRAPSRTAGRWR
jgi:hypothetical protein